MTKNAGVVAAALLLASCSGSPIKKLVCERQKGDPEPMEFIYDPQAKILYEYDEFSETLIPAQIFWEEEFQVVFTDSGKLKQKIVGGSLELMRVTEFTIVDLKNKTYKAILEREKFLPGGSEIERVTESFEGTCKSLEPETTNVFEEPVK